MPANKLTFNRSRPGRKNDGAHVEQKNWSVVRHAVGYHRYDTAAEVKLLNRHVDSPVSEPEPRQDPAPTYSPSKTSCSTWSTPGVRPPG